ncbi:MAG: flavin reductase family protein [Dehalococcoidia bacterium]
MGDEIDTREFRDAMGMFATGVTVVTIAYDGDLRGMTANAFLSLSLHPAMLIVCINESASMYPWFQVADAFGVNILASDQEPLSRAFAAHGEKAEPMGGHAYRQAALGSPVLEGALAWAECEIEERFPGGDHMIVVGRVREFAVERPDGDPLLFYRGQYHALGEAL